VSYRLMGFVVGLLSVIAIGNVAYAADSPKIDRDFWQHWGDGHAELSGYQLEYPRYGQIRKGTAVAIFVTETFSNKLRVKADPGNHAKSDEFPVLKLNLMQDFPTGLYDYNMMTSTFIALKPVNARPIGSATKVSFGSQEWCGHVYHQALFDKHQVRHTLHSYFDGEADQSAKIDHPKDAISEDALLIWARGLAWPVLAKGESMNVSVLRSLEFVRLRHRPLQWGSARLSYAEQAQQVTVPAGAFDARVMTAAIAGGPTWTFYVEDAAPHRVVKWKSTKGHKGELIESSRMKYWQMNGEGNEKHLKKIGLTPRPMAMP